MPIGLVPIKDEPRGFIPFGRMTAIHAYEATSGVIANGDVVAMSPTGKIIAAVAGSTQLMGVCAAWKASTVTTALVYDSPDQQYLVQDDATGNTVLVSTHLGLNFDLLATIANLTIKKSQHEIIRGGASTTQTIGSANIRLLGIVSVTGANSLCRVVINEHAWAKKLTGAI